MQGKELYVPGGVEEAGGPDVVLRLKVLRRSKSLSYKEGISISHCFIHQEKPVW